MDFTNIRIDDMVSSLNMDELIEKDSLEQHEQALHRVESITILVSTLFKPISKEIEAKWYNLLWNPHPQEKEIVLSS